MLSLRSPRAQGGSAQTSGFMAHVVFGGLPSGQTQTLEGETPPGRPRGLVEVAERCGDGAQVLQSRRRALRQDGKGTRVLSTLGWGRAQMSSPCPSPRRPGFRRAPDITSAVEPASLNTRQPRRRAAHVKPDATQERRRWVWGGFRCQDQNAALHGGSSSSPLAPAIRGPSASPSRRWCLQESSWWLLLSMDLPTHFFNSNHDEESMKP